MNSARFTLAAVLFIFLPQLAVAQSSVPLADVAWLTGCWTAQGGEVGSVEHWLPPAGGTMLGVGRTVKSGETIDYEFMQIRLNTQGQLVFIALPAGQAAATFVSVPGAEGETVFENPQHDFPQRVIYRSISPDRMMARIEGNDSGAIRGIDFPMQRIACEASD